MQIDAIFILGPQGSGKGTQARILAEKLGFFYYESGAILREKRDIKTPSGETIGEILDKGILLSDEMIYEIFKSKQAELPAGGGIIFDGIPRRLAQAEFLVDFLKNSGKTNLVSLFVNIPREESIKRLLLRAEIEKRADDTAEAIDIRLKQYEDAIGPVLEYLRSNTKFLEIDGRPSIPEVGKSINLALGLPTGQ